MNLRAAGALSALMLGSWAVARLALPQRSTGQSRPLPPPLVGYDQVPPPASSQPGPALLVRPVNPTSQPDPPRLELPELSEYQRMVVDTHTRDRALATRSALGAALGPVVGDLRACFANDPLPGETSPVFRFEVSSTARRGRVQGVSFVHVREGAPLSEGTTACLTATLAAVKTFVPVHPDREMLESFEGSIDVPLPLAPQDPPDAGR
jgi:hypothetical protein